MGYGFREITVEAENEEEAEQKALDVAGDYEYSEHDAKYEVDFCNKADDTN